MPLNKEQMKAYQRKRRAGLQESEQEVVNQDENVNLTPTIPVNPEPVVNLTPSLAFPRQPGRCIRCGGRVPASDNFCSDPHYQEHLDWLVSLKPPAIPGKRGELRSRLDALRAEYVEAMHRQDWATCKRVNEAREPLFYELWELEKGLQEGRYSFPAKVINQGQVFQPELTRKA